MVKLAALINRCVDFRRAIQPHDIDDIDTELSDEGIDGGWYNEYLVRVTLVGGYELLFVAYGNVEMGQYPLETIEEWQYVDAS